EAGRRPGPLPDDPRGRRQLLRRAAALGWWRSPRRLRRDSLASEAAGDAHRPPFGQGAGGRQRQRDSPSTTVAWQVVPSSGQSPSSHSSVERLPQPMWNSVVVVDDVVVGVDGPVDVVDPVVGEVVVVDDLLVVVVTVLPVGVVVLVERTV